MKEYKSKICLLISILIVVALLFVIGKLVVEVDPFMHYHKPATETYFYTLNNQRSMNDGIVKHFDYDAIIAGTSMAENFKTSEMDELFGTNSVKVPFSGGSYKEVNDNLIVAFNHNPNLRVVVRCLDMGKFLTLWNSMRTDLGEFPTYLYDDCIFNDSEYVFNRDIICSRVLPMLRQAKEEGFEPGITSFDQYSNWMKNLTFGVDTVYKDGAPDFSEIGEAVHLTDEQKAVISKNIEKNITSLAKAHPEADFYYFFSPYSACWWYEQVSNGNIYKQIEAEQFIIERILECDNIHLYSFNNRTDITTDLNNYKDNLHYGEWINSLMLKLMHDGECLLTKENYKEYIENELSFYTAYDYSQLLKQPDYECDDYAAALWNQEINDVEPLKMADMDFILQNAEVNIDPKNRDSRVIVCHGVLQRGPESEISVADYLYQTGFIGCKTSINDIGSYRYLVFYGKKDEDSGQATVNLYDQNGNVIKQFSNLYTDTDHEWHQYDLDVSDVTGPVTLIFNGGYVDRTGPEGSQYSFRNIGVY